MKNTITKALEEVFHENRIKARVSSAKENGCYYKHGVELMPGAQVAHIGLVLSEPNEKYGLHMRTIIERNRLFVITPKTGDSISMEALPTELSSDGRIPVGIGPNGPVTVGHSLLVIGGSASIRESLLGRVRSMVGESEGQTISSVFSEVQRRLEAGECGPAMGLIVSDADTCIESMDMIRQILFIARNAEKTGVYLVVSLSQYSQELGPVLSCAFSEVLSFSLEDPAFFNPKVRGLVDGEGMLFDSDMNYSYALVEENSYFL